MTHEQSQISVRGAGEHNLQNFDIDIERNQITVITGVSGSGKSSLAFDTILSEAHRRFFYTLSHYSRQFLDLGTRPKVRQIQGLSPAIGLAQNETQPSRKATVGTLSDVSELLGVLFARFGDKACPKHGASTTALSITDIADWLFAEASEQTVAVCAPIAQKKKGTFANQMSKYVQKGYSKAFIDGKLMPLSPLPNLKKEEKHSISIVIDVVKLKEGARNRLERSLETVLTQTEGFGEYWLTSAKGEPLGEPQTFSTVQGCPNCGYSWPRLDSRHFSVNSLGQCRKCRGYGELQIKDEEYGESDESRGRLDQADLVCLDCRGTGLNPELAAITLRGKSPLDLQQLTLKELAGFLQQLEKAPLKNPAMLRVVEEVTSNVRRMVDVGIGYLNLRRRVTSLSGGEAQRLRLSGVLGEKLRGVLYVFDEPSQGLHPTELDQIWDAIENLKKLGNTVILVDHDESIIRRADWVIDLGPGGGVDGGRLMAKFRPQDAAKFAGISLTANHLCRIPEMPNAAPARFHEFITINKPSLNNLRMSKVRIPLGAITVVTGVSGAGKSSLVQGVLFENSEAALASRRKGARRKPWRYCEEVKGLDAVSSCHLIDRKPVAKSSVSMPATYLDVFTELRNLYAKLPDAQVVGLDARAFSLHLTGGRCEECQGKGQISLNMRFLAAAKVTCPVCKGARYRGHVQALQYHGKSLSDVLELTIKEAVEHFQHFPKIVKRLRPACDLGLGYLKLGQLSMNLSGGESQRLKLVTLFAKSHSQGSLVILDEPTRGLHFEDVMCLIHELRKLVAQGATIVVIEHSVEMILAADWLVDLGPGASQEGGQLLFEGPPQALLSSKDSVTAKALPAALKLPSF